MDQTSQTHGHVSTALQQWLDARIHLSKAIQAYISATTFLQSMCTPFSIKSTAEALPTIENNIKTVEREQIDLQKAQAALKKKRDSFNSPIDVLPPELLSCIFTTAVASASGSQTSERYVKRNLSRVCSRWRQIALEVCPLWSKVSLILELDSVSRDEVGGAEIELYGLPKGPTRVPVRRRAGFSDALVIQQTLDIIVPYIRQLCRIDLSADSVEQLQPFLNLLLEKGTPVSLTGLSLSTDKAALAFPEASMHLGECWGQCLKHLEFLTLSSVGLDWSVVTFDKLRSMILSELPPFCSPTLAQLARMLSTCRNLHTLRLENVTMLTSPDIVAPEHVELKCLERLTLNEVDASRILPIIHPGHLELSLELQDLIDDTDTLDLLRLFASRANIHELYLKLPDTRSDETLAQLLHLAVGPLLGLGELKLRDMNLHNSELDALANSSPSQNGDSPSSALMGTRSNLAQFYQLEFLYCTIHTTPEAFHNAFSAFPWIRLRLFACSHTHATQEENSLTDVLQLIRGASGFGARLSQLMPGRVSFFSW
ncbi:hypothetical protein BDV93DRAFT_524672 [Ceratobasidium sp. AG-I]|nr:hypothetical protein BDV93DRAFT_524672 [Ceratobasidium sp. AG-I]